MIDPQYTYDNSGNKIGVFLAIEDWYELEQIPAVREIAKHNVEVPDWQVELGKRELENIRQGNAELMEWGEAKKQFKL